MSALAFNTLTEQGLFNGDTVQFVSKTSVGATPSSGTKFYSLNGHPTWLNTDGFSRTLTSTVTSNRTYTLPDLTDTIVALTPTQTLTNKTLTDTTNNVTAKGIFSASTTVDVSAATAPSSGQILTATSGTTANWQVPSNSAIQNYTVTSSTTFTSSSTSYVSITGMTITPNDPGRYLVFFNTSFGPSSSNTLFSVAIFLNGVLVSDSVRQYGDTAYVCIPMSTVVDWTTGTIEARLKTSGTAITLNNRSLVLIRLS